MEKNKRTKNNILLGFIGGFFMMAILLSIVFFKLKPEIEEIGLKKLELKKSYDYFVINNKKGINFSDFKSIANENSEVKNDLYITSVINSIDKNFYEKNIGNNTPSTFNDYIIKKQKSLNEIELEVSSEEEKINKVLPMYIDNINLGDKIVINDFNLINNIESLFKTFNLSYGNKVSISNIFPVDVYGIIESDNLDNVTKSSIAKLIESDIFSINMSTTVSGTKLDLKNFLHYLENVGSLKIVGNKIDYYKDDFIKNISGEKVILNNDNNEIFKNYNIYNNQLVNIKNIKINSKFVDEKVPLNENVSLDIEILFFVRGLPNNKKQEFINKFLANYKELSNSINEVLKNSSDEAKKQELLKLKNYLSTMNSNIISINKDLGNIEKLDNTFKKALEYNKNFLKIKSLSESFVN